MKPIIFYDTETTGLPEFKLPSESECQPHIVQLAAILADEDTRNVLATLNVIVKPEGWIIPEESIAVHGITQDVAEKVGLPEKEVVSLFYQLCQGAKRVAHNRTFDQRIVRIALKRYEFSEEYLNKWAEKEDHDCTMLMAKPIMQLPPKLRYGYKSPRLEEAYKYFTDRELVNAHSALADATACMEIYWAMKDLEESKELPPAA